MSIILSKGAFLIYEETLSERIADIFIILVPPFGFIIYYDVTLKSIGKLKIITDVW